MSRKNISKKRFPTEDFKYNSLLVSLFVLKILKSGKKSLAEKIVYNTFNLISTNTNQPPLKIFEKAIRNVSPEVEIKTRRIGGSTRQVPVKVTNLRGTHLALRWIIKFAKKRKGKTMSINLANEITDAANKFGNSIKRKQEVYKMAEANKAFVQFKKSF